MNKGDTFNILKREFIEFMVRKMKNRHSLKQTYLDTKLMLKYLWQGDKVYVILRFISIFLDATLTLLRSLYLKWIIDAISTNNLINVVKIVIILNLTIWIIDMIYTKITNINTARKEYKLKNYLQRLFIKKAMLQDLECYENEVFYDTYTKAIRVADSKAIHILNHLMTVIQSIISSLAYLAIIFTFSPTIMIIIIVMVIITFYDQNVSNRYSHELYEAEQSINRKAEYIKRLSHYKAFAKEVRLNNLSSFLLDKINSSFKERYKLFKESNLKYWRFKNIIFSINLFFITPALILHIAYQTIKGALTLGEFTFLYSSCFSISSSLADIIRSFDNLNFESEYFVSYLRVILEYKPKIENDLSDDKLHIDKINQIEFRNVTFKYPGHKQIVLDDLSFTIKQNEKVALVGKNGAGKSTIIKLLMRLYDVSQGEVLINNIDIKKYNIKELRKCYSSVMQDYNIFAFSIKDNLCLGQRYSG